MMFGACPNSAASPHMASYNGKLESSIPYSCFDKIMVGNGEILDITHIWGCKFKSIGTN